jgi:hypothetical protein
MRKKQPQKNANHLCEIKSRKYHKDHSKKRCKERYGIELTNSKFKKLHQMIDNKICYVVRRERSTGMTVYGVLFENKSMWILYDNKSKQIITFLPNEQQKGEENECNTKKD